MIKEKLKKEMLLEIDNEFVKAIPVEIDDCEIRLEENYPAPQYIMSIHDNGTAPKANLIAVTGQAKAGKSTALALLATILLHGAEEQKRHASFGIRGLIVNPTVAYFDTEMDSSDTHAWMQRTQQMCGWSKHKSHPRLHVFNLRKKSIIERREKIEENVRKYNPDVVIIDNIRDLLTDFNNIQDVTEFMNWLMLLTDESGAAVFCVLHQNKNDHSMRGHLGTELLNKCYLSLQLKKSVEKDKVVFTLSAGVSRGKMFDDVNFTLDEEGMPIPVEADYKPASKKEKVTKEEKKSQSIDLSAFQEIYAESVSPSLPYTVLQNKWMEKTGKSSATFGRLMKEHKDEIFIQHEGKNYSLRNL